MISKYDKCYNIAVTAVHLLNIFLVHGINKNTPIGEMPYYELKMKCVNDIKNIIEKYWSDINEEG